MTRIKILLMKENHSFFDAKTSKMKEKKNINHLLFFENKFEILNFKASIILIN